MLTLEQVVVRFGGVHALDGVDLTVHAGEIVSVIGPNGAGKTTLFNAVTGLVPVTRGRIRFEEHDLTGAKPHQVAAYGIRRTFQSIRLFSGLSVEDNVVIGRHAVTRGGPISAILRTPSLQRSERESREKARALLAYTGVHAEADMPAGNLPYGQQRRLEIARALAGQPRLLLLDEPAAGMNPQETNDLMALVRKIRDDGITVWLIEHDMRVVMNISDRVAVLDHGKKIAEGQPADVQRNPQVIEAYLGSEASVTTAPAPSPTAFRPAVAAG